MAVRTLIVDDAPTARTILRRRLGAVGCEIVAEADSSAAADDMIAGTSPDLITLDIHMPEIRGMDSYALFRKVRRERPQVEFVVISGANYFQNRQDFLREGALGFFAKPIDFHGLLNDLRGIFPELKPYRLPPSKFSSGD
ncbi:MAG: response regulator [Candidatus Binataceae bacterium]|jgi:YesN/AraC family two-component response regulator